MTALTFKTIEGLKASDEQFEVVDDATPGLRLRVSQKGRKTFYLMYRFRGKKHRTKLGVFPDISLAEARQAAQEISSKARNGSDPKAKIALSEGGLKTVSEMAELFFEKHVRLKNKPRTQIETIRMIRKDIIQPWGDRDVRDINELDAQDLIDEIEETRSAYAAGNTFKACRKFFNWLVERRIIESSPFIRVRNPVRIQKRDRVLEEFEIKAIWNATYELGEPWGAIIRLLFLTAARRSEISEARFEEFDRKNMVWTLPGERAKNRKSSYKPITKMMLYDLEALSSKDEGLLFPAQRDGSKNAVSGFSKMKIRLDRISGVSDWRLHDIRRCVATQLGALNIPDELIARVLDHSLVGVPQVTSTYNRHKYIPQLKKALEMWHERLKIIIKNNDETEEGFGF